MHIWDKTRKRIVAIIAHVDHGKSTLRNCFLKSDLVINVANENSLKVNNYSNELTVLLDHEIESGAVNSCTIVINFLTSHGNVDFNPDHSSLLRLTDGVLIVVDCIEGVACQTEILLRQSMQERLKPVLLINKLDRVLIELQMTGEEIYQLLLRVIEQMNGLIDTFKWSNDVNWKVSPSNGTVAFGSGLQQWGFTLKTIARYYATKFNTTPEQMVDKLWGDWVFVTLDGKSKWVHSDKMVDGVDKTTGIKRSFVMFILDPIIAMCNSAMNNEVNKKCELKMNNLARAVGVDLSDEIKATLHGKALFVYIMQKWLPLTDTILDMIVVHLPSPLTAQTYRYVALYNGQQNDETALAIKACDSSPSALLTMFVSKMIPIPQLNNRFMAYGRVFSGTMRKGQIVRVLVPHDIHSSEVKDVCENITVESVVIIVNGQAVSVDELLAGNLCGVMGDGIDGYLIKSGSTITTSDMTKFLGKGVK